MNLKTNKLALLLIIVLTVSCVPKRQLSYFNDINEMSEPVVNPRMQKLIMPFDKIYIKVLSIDAATSQIFNTTEELSTASYGRSSGLLGYLVDEGGNVNFPFVGNINVGGLTTSQAAEKIQKALSDYVSNTSVSVKFVENQVTVMGEVQNQGVFNFTQDKLNIYEALGMGGGITRYGDRKNVILMRHEGDKIMHYKLNLSDSKIASKDYYYILPNDVIVVEPLRAVSTSYSNITYTTILQSVTTLISILVTILTLNNL
ncbi:MAG: Polysaccharide biosynthesis/export protein [Bacteroidetes bacterium ADurb.Bin145]|jgi:polysaccharide export outer membrane protein|nr:MAG: Polysaccharide biosynthesis/export protein [Bacteroidetes bacterium ADurb.Bin145]